VVKKPQKPMARYKPYDYDQTHLIPVSLEEQLLEGSLEHAIHVLVENKMDLGMFDCRYHNDETGCKAYDPKILLNVVLFAYSRGFVGSRRIEWLCRTHVTCMALACMQHPDHSTIAAFISSMDQEILSLFREILLVCEEQHLLGGTVFALDGLKLSSNASKQWSGTFDELKHKQEKLEAKIEQLLAEHQQIDAEESDGKAKPRPVQDAPNDAASLANEPSAEKASSAKEAQSDESEVKQAQKESTFAAEGQGKTESIEQTCQQDSPASGQKSGTQRWVERLKRLRRHADRLKDWLSRNAEKIGRQGKAIKSNVTDNESAKMATSHGVIQGYNAQAVVDGKHQVIVGAQAFGDGQDGQHLSLVMEGLKENMEAIGHGEDYFEGKQLLADSNYFSDTNLKTCEHEKLDAYIPDCNFRKRDLRFADQKRYKPKKQRKKQRFGVDDFTYDEATQCDRCPHGKLLRLKVREHRLKHRIYRRYVANEEDCRECPFRSKCLSQKKTKRKHLGIPVEEPETKPKSRCQTMIEKIDTAEGKKQYSQRVAIVEPVFANIRTQKGLDHFTLRGKQTVDIQWTLYAMVHNIEKIANYGEIS
jgi:transposase